MRLTLRTVLLGTFLVVILIEFEVVLSSLQGKRDTYDFQRVVSKAPDSPTISFDTRISLSSLNFQPSQRFSRRPFTVDVLSTGSTSRWNYVITQQQTWGSHPSIRHFEGVNETQHEIYNASCQGIKQQVSKCFELANLTKRERNYFYAPEIKRLTNLFRKKSEGWMCAQHRPIIGLHSIYGPRYRSGEDLPDWLLIVDDDTTFHMNVLEVAVTHLNPDTAHVFVGKYIFHGWPLGGFGVLLSRAAIRRLFLPLDCNNPVRNKSKSRDFQNFSKTFCEITLPRNTIFELDAFTDGMSILDLMLAIQLNRKPFCWHSDWYMGWFLTNHVMLGQPLPKFPLCPAPFDCQPDWKVCEPSILMCHDKDKNQRFEHLLHSNV